MKKIFQCITEQNGICYRSENANHLDNSLSNQTSMNLFSDYAINHQTKKEFIGAKTGRK